MRLAGTIVLYFLFSMKSVQLVAPRVLEAREMSDPPDPGPGEVLVRIRSVGICGSDMHWYVDGGIGPFRAVYPQVLGHEPAGEIVAAGSGVNTLKPGQRIAMEPTLTCGHCEYCRSGRHNNCTSALFMGSPQKEGLLREYAVIPAQNAIRIPDGMSFNQATIIEPLAVILHVLELQQIRIGETVAVMGAGPIGLLTASVMRIAGASRVFVADKLPHRLEIAKCMGVADVTVNVTNESVVEAVMDHTRGRGVDIALDAVGAPESINNAIAVARAGGRVVLIGIPGRMNLPIDILAALAKELNIQTIRRSNENTHAAIDVLEKGLISDRLVTHYIPLEKAPLGFETLANYGDGVGKIIIEIP